MKDTNPFDELWDERRSSPDYPYDDGSEDECEYDSMDDEPSE